MIPKDELWWFRALRAKYIYHNVLFIIFIVHSPILELTARIAFKDGNVKVTTRASHILHSVSSCRETLIQIRYARAIAKPIRAILSSTVYKA